MALPELYDWAYRPPLGRFYRVLLDGKEVSHVEWCVTGGQGFGQSNVTNDDGSLVAKDGDLVKERFRGNVVVEKIA